ncbi:hypothetical protein ASF32_07345 [Methylobacterium sp. Leaf91]|nr:hypothetical protein ASF32_07345 [Methylobacterium sp. Leaf91]
MRVDCDPPVFRPWSMLSLLGRPRLPSHSLRFSLPDGLTEPSQFLGSKKPLTLFLAVLSYLRRRIELFGDEVALRCPGVHRAEHRGGIIRHGWAALHFMVQTCDISSGNLLTFLAAEAGEDVKIESSAVVRQGARLSFRFQVFGQERLSDLSNRRGRTKPRSIVSGVFASRRSSEDLLRLPASFIRRQSSMTPNAQESFCGSTPTLARTVTDEIAF